MVERMKMKWLIISGRAQPSSWDSGSTCGEITGHAKPITSIDVRHQRPFKAISGSDDNTVILHSGVPFKYEKTLTQHTRFVQDVRYSPDGEAFVSVGSDGKMFVYEGKTGEIKGEVDRAGSTSSLVSSIHRLFHVRH